VSDHVVVSVLDDGQWAALVRAAALIGSGCSPDRAFTGLALARLDQFTETLAAALGSRGDHHGD
jgi:hypothetical protein